MTVDTYDQAFGLLALAWDFRVTGNSESKTAAREALRGLDEDCADPRFGGYREWRNGDSASPMVIYPNFRRQNPHMHLFEAFLAWHTSDPSGPWLERAGDMVSLLRSRFRRPGNGTLAEYFGEAWDLAPGEAGVIREPGHHYEWVWLLKRYEEITGDSSVRKDAEELYRFAREHGTDADGLAFGAVDDKGRIVDDRKPLWPQTETLKAHLAMYEWTGAPAAGEAADRSLSAIKTRYMREDGALFYNLIDRDGKPDPAPSLSRLLYHLFVAAAEAERVLG
jgi:mannose/cellobiose epimerase-like protein (N-acyl-D-glucosamine 2-epimerase family)